MPGLNRRGGDGNKKDEPGARRQLSAARTPRRGSGLGLSRQTPAPSGRSPCPRRGTASWAAIFRGRERKGTGRERQRGRETAAAMEQQRGTRLWQRARPRSAPHRRPPPAGTPPARSQAAGEGDLRRAAQRRERGARCCQLK